ncbi:MAG: hypothetical protein JWO80_2335 [Bryobacterales bacterium]|nr:hypothetical protein [Bryobacterales bacterium]
MKKLAILALGLGLALGSVSFAQDKMDDKKTDTKKKKKGGKKKTDTPPPAATK